MELSESELCMLEQLCYLNRDVAAAAGIEEKFGGIRLIESEGQAIEDILEVFDETALANLEALGDEEVGGACASGKEWADIIRYIKSSNLKDLVLTDTMENSNGTTLALCFAETADSSEAIVAFKGTTGKQEWIDNVEGLNIEETKLQKEALDFIESLKYTNITVTGHSKGGNKAMYVAITSDKVTRCVAFDGQGFSQEFINKYWAEIQAKGKNISNYSLATDYVHALLFPVPNSNQFYCIGYGVDNMKQHHSPNSFFMQDNGGNLWIDESGNIIIRITKEEESITMLHEFTTFIMNNADGKDEEKIIEYVSGLVAMAFGGSEISKQEIIDYALSDPDSLALVLAYLVKYMDVYDLDADDIDKLLETLGLNSLNQLITITQFEFLGDKYNLNVNLANILNLIKQNLTDGDDDWIIKRILPLLKSWFFDDVDIDVSDLWERINSKVKAIDTSGGKDNAKVRTGKIYDFSQNVYDTLMSTISKIENISISPVESWSSYASEEWYSQIFVPIAISGIRAYFDKLSETNLECKRRIDTIFENVLQTDSDYAKKITENNNNLETINNNLLEGILAS
ncbi:Mbeg1-like protein [Roseburia sp. 499]|uniref:Mbeg1-like protein n=1 Tax=Roseburia sp. 499 TaxID=1261634 RepID=UPI0009534D83|nr:Mbeg1-like protein [Roseburia sp. 499]WVK70857.1 Mbeg1-like protein [Roseburia sp. 499]